MRCVSVFQTAKIGLDYSIIQESVMTIRKPGIKSKNHVGKPLDTHLATYFLSLSVQKVRCFGPAQTLDLSNGQGCPARWTIILGDNGVGKTTLLQSLVSIVPAPSQVASTIKDGNTIEGAENASKSYSPNAKIFKPEQGPPSSVRGRGPSQIIASFIDMPGLVEIGEKRQVGELMIYATAHSLMRSSIKYADIALFGYGASRRTAETSFSDETTDDTTATLFSEGATLLNAEEWLLQADYAASKPSRIKEQAKKRRDQIKEVLVKLLPDVNDIRFTQLSEAQMKPRIEVKTPYGWVSIKDLSLGYKTLIAWMVDLASRLFDKYTDSPNPLAEPAVVLVDEIDLHLHPKWQRSLMGYLSELFPNTQFIATAHSPLVVQAAIGANIVVLRRDGDHVVIDNDVEAIRGWRIDQVLTSDLFGLETARPPQLDNLLAERKRILSKGRITEKDKGRLRKLENKIGPLPAGETPKDMEAMDIIRRAAARLKQH
jgi:GTPase SAR1 family protein